MAFGVATNKALKRNRSETKGNAQIPTTAAIMLARAMLFFMEVLVRSMLYLARPRRNHMLHMSPLSTLAISSTFCLSSTSVKAPANLCALHSARRGWR